MIGKTKSQRNLCFGDPSHRDSRFNLLQIAQADVYCLTLAVLIFWGMLGRLVNLCTATIGTSSATPNIRA